MENGNFHTFIPKYTTPNFIVKTKVNKYFFKKTIKLPLKFLKFSHLTFYSRSFNSGGFNDFKYETEADNTSAINSININT